LGGCAGAVQRVADLVEELRAHVGSRQPNDHVFAGIRNGAPLRVSTFRVRFGVAARPSASPTCTRTSCATPPPASRSHQGRM
jgi:hypothetical protein